jgi:hypothetical protein
MALTTGLVPLFGLPTEWRQGGKIARAGARVTKFLFEHTLNVFFKNTQIRELVNHSDFN